MLDAATLERDLRFLKDLAHTDAFEALRRDLPAPLRPGIAIVDLDRFMTALRATCAATLGAQPERGQAPALAATAQVAHSLVNALRELLEARDSEAAGWEALAELQADPA